jgi:hypothetical protein
MLSNIPHADITQRDLGDALAAIDKAIEHARE